MAAVEYISCTLVPPGIEGRRAHSYSFAFAFVGMKMQPNRRPRDQLSVVRLIGYRGCLARDDATLVEVQSTAVLLG